MGYALGADLDGAQRAVQAVLERLLPAALDPGESVLDPVLEDVVRTRLAAGLWGAVGFLWFSTRLFGALRSVLAVVFEQRNRSIIRGKLWDLHLTVTSAALIGLWVVISTWLAVSSGRVGRALIDAGMRAETLSGLEYAVGRLAAVAVIVAVFASLYRWLPAQRTPWRLAGVGALTSAGLFEAARWAFALLFARFSPASVYTGTLGALIVIVFWTYYAAIIFIVGAEVARTTERFHAAQAPATTP